MLERAIDLLREVSDVFWDELRGGVVNRVDQFLADYDAIIIEQSKADLAHAGEVRKHHPYRFERQ